MPPDPRSLLANVTASAWNRYASTVWTGGTPKQRQWALRLAVKADDALAAHDHAERESRATYTKAKATKAKAKTTTRGK